MTMSLPLDVPGDPGAGYRITRIGPASIGDFLAVWNECATWLTARGIAQWAPVDPTTERVAVLAAKTSSQEWYLIHCGNELAGAFTLRWDDPKAWGEQPPDAGYVHSLCVRRQFAGRALGHAMLDWAARRVAAQGRPWLRLDCRTSSSVLRAYYAAAGFFEVPPAPVTWAGSTLFQRSTTSESTDDDEERDRGE